MEWRRYVPNSGGPKWPAVLVVHVGGFRGGSPFDGGPSKAATDLQDAGYLVFEVTYRLAPCGRITNQPAHDNTTDAGRASGRPPEQTDDIEAEVRAARLDSQCNGKVGIVGGSAGASHAAFAALDTRTIANWGPADRPDATVCLSGAYDFSDREDATAQFIYNIENYTNSCVLTEQKEVSPVARVTSPTESVPFKPIFLINTDGDPMPFHQIIDLQCAFQTAGVDPSLYKVLTLEGSKQHAFAYWDDYDDGYPFAQKVSTRVIAFLDSYLK